MQLSSRGLHTLRGNQSQTSLLFQNYNIALNCTFNNGAMTFSKCRHLVDNPDDENLSWKWAQSQKKQQREFEQVLKSRYKVSACQLKSGRLFSN